MAKHLRALQLIVINNTLSVLLAVSFTDGATSLIFGPAEIFSDEVVEPLIVLYKKLAQFRNYRWVHSGVLASFSLAQTLICRVVAQAIETFRFVEVEVSSSCSGNIGICKKVVIYYSIFKKL